MTTDAHRIWAERTRRLGLDPDRHDKQAWRTVAVAGVHELKRMLDLPELAEQRPSLIPSGAAAREASPLTLRRAIIEHATGIAAITDEDALNEASTRFPEFPLDVLNAVDITVTADKPLIINSSQAVTNFGTVTIEPGGYIEISVACKFGAQKVLKPRPTAAPSVASPYPGYDLILTAPAGAAGAAGKTGTDGGAGGSGTQGRCDCCGGEVASDGTDGADGTAGSDGLGGTQGGKGGDPPPIVVVIDDLASTISVLNVGGAGGNGGHGGDGGKGGAGGNGGQQEKCGAYTASGGNGGNGGKGCNGGDGGNSGDGGDGGNPIIHFTTQNGSEILYSDAQAPAGEPGTGGNAGKGGAYGKGGGKNAKDGKEGAAGEKGGKNGTRGVPGRAGKTSINPTTVSR